MDIPVLNKQGQEVSKISIDVESLGGEINPALIKQAFVRYHANQRQGSARSKNRSMVEGSTRKLYRQKGTGNARAGAIRTPIRKGGGHAHNKTRTREDYRVDMPVKMRRKANRNALLAKLHDPVRNEDGALVGYEPTSKYIRVVDDLAMDSPKTRDFQQIIAALGIDRSCVVALNIENKNARLSARNIEGVSVCNAAQLTCWELMNHRYLVIAKSDLEAWLAGPSSKTDKSAKSPSGAGNKGSRASYPSKAKRNKRSGEGVA
ncbi:MAG: 50S ribosomal protein L4 [Planctomycetota bacterium]